MARPGKVWLAVVAVAALLSACGGSGEAPSSVSGASERAAGVTEGAASSSPSATPPDDGATASPAPSPTVRVEATTAPPPPTQTAQDEGFAYVPWGPDDPPVPQRYASLASASATGARCEDAQANQLAGPFWDLAVSVCRAIAGEGTWPSATAVPSPPAARNDYEACLDAELAAMLDRALRWHAANPGGTPTVRYPARSVLSPCQVRIFSTSVLDASDALYPDPVPAGRLAVGIFAGSADDASTVTVDGSPAEVAVVEPASGAAMLVVLAAAPTQARTAQVAVTTARGVLTSTVSLPAAPSADPTHSPPVNGGGTGAPSSSATPDGGPSAPASPPGSSGP